MQSRTVVNRLVRARRTHKKTRKISFLFEASSNRFSFANGEQSNVREKLVIYFENDLSTLWVDLNCVRISRPRRRTKPLGTFARPSSARRPVTI